MQLMNDGRRGLSDYVKTTTSRTVYGSLPNPFEAKIAVDSNVLTNDENKSLEGQKLAIANKRVLGELAYLRWVTR